MKKWLSVFLAGMAMQIQANGYWLRERLDSAPASARLEGGGETQTVRGRHAGVQALQLTGGALAWDVQADRDGFIEFWMKPVSWDALTAEEVPVGRFRIGETDYRLFKAAGEAELRLTAAGQPSQHYPIYNWTEQKWMGGDQAVRWHYINLAVSDGRLVLFVDGFPARVGEIKLSDDKALQTARLSHVTLEGGPGTAFADLHIVPGLLDGKALRARYRALYTGQPALNETTVTVPWVERAPIADGVIDQDEYAGLAKMTGFNTLGGGVTAFESSGMTAYIGYDAEHLYFALETPYTGELKVRPHGKHAERGLWSDEVIEFFLCPPWTGVPEYVQLVGNAMGGTLDLRGLNAGWRGNWFWEAKPGKDVWSGELKVPFEGVEMPSPGDASVWSMNLFNTEARAAWCSSGAYHDTGAFGVLRFDRQTPVFRPGTLAFTDHQVSLPIELIGRGEQRTYTVGLEVYAPGDVLPSQAIVETLVVGEGEQEIHTLSADLTGLETGMLVVYAREGDTILYYRPGRFPVAPPSVREGHGKPVSEVSQKVETDAETKPVSEADQAYARRWSAEELGQELLQMPLWLDAGIGESDTVMPPWTPVEVEGQSVRCWGRTYRYADTLFPVQIVSQDDDHLVSAPAVEVVADGQLHRFSAGTVTLRKNNDSLATVVTEGVSGPFTLRVTTEYEFDGMAKVDMTLSGPVGVSAERMELVIPVRSAKSSLFHYIGNGGHPPTTDSGAVPAAGFSLDEFHSLIWLGDERSGLCWFAEDMKNWPISSEEAIHRFVRTSGGDGELRIKLGDKPFVPGQGWQVVFGLQATPTRPRHPRFRERSDFSAVSQPWHWADGQYYPFHADGERARADVERMRQQGRMIQPVSSLYYYGRYRYGIGQLGPIESPGLLHRELLLWEGLWQATQGGGTLPTVPERHTAAGDWYGKKTQPNGLTHLCAASPWQDYYIWRFQQEVEATGLRSTYLDQGAYRCDNALHGCGYIDYRGEWVPSVKIFAMRNMLKRIRRVLVDAHGDDIEIRFHMSNQLLVPVLAFADTSWDGENYLFGPMKVFEFYSDILTDDRLRAQHTGLPFGFAHDLLPEYRQYAPTPASVRDMIGMFWTIDSNVSPIWSAHTGLVRWLQAKRLSYQPDDMKVAYYWEPESPVKVDAPSVRHILHYGPDQAILILYNRIGQPVESRVTIDTHALFGEESLPLVDAITGEVIAVDGGQYTMPLAPRDFRLFELKRGGDAASTGGDNDQ